MATDVVFKLTGKPVPSGTIIQDHLGRDWEFTFGAKPGLSDAGRQCGDIYVRRRPGYGSQKGFSPNFFPDVQFSDDWQRDECALSAHSLEGEK